MQFAPLGDSAVLIELGKKIGGKTLQEVRILAGSLEASPLPGVKDIVPSFTTVTVHYDAARPGGYARLCEDISARAKGKKIALKKPRTHLIPVCYGGEFGPDLPEIARHAKLKPEVVISLHSKASYLVHAIGFTPGFPYLGGLPSKIETPRRSTPRASVPAGSVGIGGAQTGIYPMESPGGWQLIGRTPLQLFDPGEKEPALLRAGDEVRFKAITPEEFVAWK